MERQITISLEITPHPSELFRKNADNVSISETSTIYDLLALLYESYLTSDRYYDEDVGWVNIFWRHLLFKSGEFIGSFDKKGFEPRKGAHITLKDGDRVIIIPPLGGG